MDSRETRSSNYSGIIYNGFLNFVHAAIESAEIKCIYRCTTDTSSAHAIHIACSDAWPIDICDLKLYFREIIIVGAAEIELDLPGYYYNCHTLI